MKSKLLLLFLFSCKPTFYNDFTLVILSKNVYNLKLIKQPESDTTHLIWDYSNQKEIHLSNLIQSKYQLQIQEITGKTIVDTTFNYPTNKSLTLEIP